MLLMFIKMCLNVPSITRRLHPSKCVNRTQLFFLVIFIVIVNEFIATNWMIFFIWVLTHALQWNWWDFFCVFTNKKNHLKLCVEMLSIERERLTPQKKRRKKKSHTECLVWLLPCYGFRIKFWHKCNTSPSYRLLLLLLLIFIFCCKIRGLSSN